MVGEKRSGIDFVSFGGGEGTRVLDAEEEVVGGGREGVEEGAEGETDSSGMVDGGLDDDGIGEVRRMARMTAVAACRIRIT